MCDEAGLTTRSEREYAGQILRGLATSRPKVEALEAAMDRLTGTAAPSAARPDAPETR